MFKRILYIVLLVLCSIVAKAQFVAEVNYLARWDEVTGLTAPSVGQYKILGTFFDRDGRGYVPSDIIPDSNYYYIDALEREFKIMLVNSSSPFVIEVDPVGHDKAPAKGYGQLTQVTTNTKQYFVTGGVSPRLRAAILNKNILRLSQYIDAELDISQYIGDSLQPILRQPAEPASLLTFWKKIGDTVYLYAPYADHFEKIAYKFQIDSLGSLIEQDTFVSDSDIKANAGIVLTKLQDIPDQTLLGNGTGNTGPPDTIYLDTTLVILNDSLKVDTTLVATRAFVLNSVIADDQMATEVPYMGVPGIFNVDQALDSLFNQTITPGIDSVGEENIKQGTTFPFSVLDSIDAKHLFGNPNSVRDTLKQIAIDSSFRIYDDTLRLDTTDRIATKYDIAISGNTDDQTAVEVPYLYNGQANVKTALDSLFELTLGGDRITNNTLLDEDISSSADIQLTKLQDITKNRLLGRNNSTNGPPEQLTPGYGIYIDGLVVKVDTSEVSTLYYVTQKVADSTSNLRIVLGDSMTIIRNIAQQNFDSLEQTLADTALTLRGLITALSPANIDSIIREIDTLNAWVDTVNITTIWDTLTVHRIDINKNDSSILVNKANISVNYGLIQNNTTNIGIINLTLLDIQDTLTAHNNRLLALEALTDSISPPQFVDSIGWDGDTLALRLSDTSIVTKARLIIPNSDSLATFTIVDSIWTLTTADGLIFKDTFNQIYYDDSAIYDSLAAHLSLIFGNSTLIQANKTELLDSISAHRTKLGALETSIGVNSDTSTAIRSDLNNLINIVNALPLNNADSITSVTFTETDTTIEFRLQTIDGLDFRDTFALSVYDDAWIYDSLALSFARHITQGDTLIVHNIRINALYDSLATITGTDDQIASEVPYTNNGQTTTQTALDSLFNKDVILSASITSLDGRVTTLEGDVNVINDTLIAHNNRLIVLENKPDTVLKQGVDQFTFVADVLSLSLSDTNQVVQVTIPISTIDTIVTAFIYQDTIVRIQTNNDLFSIPVRVKKTILPLLYPIQDSIASYDTRITNNSNAIDAIDTRVSLNEADIAILQSGLALVTIKADNNEDSIMVHRTDINTLFSLIGSFTNNPDDSLLTFSSVDTIFTITTADGNTYTDTLRLSDIPILYDSISVHRGDLDSIFNILNTTGPTAPGDSIVSFITVTDSIVRITTHDGNIYNTTVGFTKYINIVLDSIAQHLTRIEGIEGDISVLQSAVAVNANNISKNLDSLVVHNTRINNNVDSINANKVRIAQNETDIVEVNDSLTAIRIDVGANLDSIFSHRSVLNSILATLIINGDTLTQHGLDISILYGLINAIVADSTTSFTAVDSVLTITTADGNIFKDTLRLSELVAAFDSLAQHRTELDALASLSIVDEVADSIVTFEVLADSTLRITSFDGSVYNATVGFTKYINAIYDSLSVHWTQIAANRDSIISNEARILANEIDIAVAQSAIALHAFDIADLQDTVIIHNIRINELFDSNAAQRGDIDSLFNRSWVTDFRRNGNNLVLENDFNTYIVPDRVEVFDTVLYEGDYWDVPVSYLQDYRVLNISISSKSIFQGVDSVWFRLPEADTSMRFTQINVNNSYYSIGAGGDPSLNAQVRFNDLNVVYHFDIIGEAKTNLGNTLGDWLIDSVEYNDSQGKGFWYINNTSTESEKFYLGLLQADYVIKYMPDIYPTPLSDGWSVYKRGSGTAANIYYRYENDTTYADQSNITVEVALDSLLAQQSRHTDSLARHRVEIDSIVTQAVNYTSLDTFFTNLGGTIDLRQLCKDYDLIDIKHRMLEVDVDSQITYILLDPADPDLRVKTIRFNGRAYNGQADAFLFDIEGTDEFWSFGDFTGRTSVQTSSGNSPEESYKIYRGQNYSPQKYWTPLEFKPVRSAQGVNNYYWFVDDGRLDSRFVEYDANGQTTATEALDSLFSRNIRQDDTLTVLRTDVNTLKNKNHITDVYSSGDSVYINSEDTLWGLDVGLMTLDTTISHFSGGNVTYDFTYAFQNYDIVNISVTNISFGDIVSIIIPEYNRNTIRTKTATLSAFVTAGSVVSVDGGRLSATRFADADTEFSGTVGTDTSYVYYTGNTYLPESSNVYKYQAANFTGSDLWFVSNYKNESHNIVYKEHGVNTVNQALDSLFNKVPESVDTFYRTQDSIILETVTQRFAIQDIDSFDLGNRVYFSKVLGNNTTGRRGDPNYPFEDPWSAYAVSLEGDIITGLTRDTFDLQPTDTLGDNTLWYVETGIVKTAFNHSQSIYVHFFPGSVVKLNNASLGWDASVEESSLWIKDVKLIGNGNSPYSQFYVYSSDGNEIVPELRLENVDLDSFGSLYVEAYRANMYIRAQSWLTDDINNSQWLDWGRVQDGSYLDVEIGQTNLWYDNRQWTAQFNPNALDCYVNYKVTNTNPNEQFVYIGGFARSNINFSETAERSTWWGDIDSSNVTVNIINNADDGTSLDNNANIYASGTNSIFRYNLDGTFVGGADFLNLYGSGSRHLVSGNVRWQRSPFEKFSLFNVSQDYEIDFVNLIIDTLDVSPISFSSFSGPITIPSIRFFNSTIETSDSSFIDPISLGTNSTTPFEFYNTSIIYTGVDNIAEYFDPDFRYIMDRSSINVPEFDAQTDFDSYITFINNESLEDALKVRNVTASGDHTLRFETKQSIHRSENTTQFTSDSTDINFIAINEGGTIRLQSDIIKIPNLDVTNPTDSVFGLAAIVNGDTLRRMPLSDLASQLQDSTVFGDASLRFDTTLYAGDTWAPPVSFLSQYSDVVIRAEIDDIFSLDSVKLVLPKPTTDMNKTKIWVNYATATISTNSGVYFEDKDIFYYFDIEEDFDLVKQPNSGIDNVVRTPQGSYIINADSTGERFYPATGQSYLIQYYPTLVSLNPKGAGYTVTKMGHSAGYASTYYNISETGSSTIRTVGKAIDTLFNLIYDVENISGGLTRLDTVASNADLTLTPSLISNNGLILISHAEAISGIAASHSEITFPRADSTLSKTEIFIQAYDNDGTYDVRLIGDTFQLTGVNSEIVTLETATLYRVQAVRQPSVQSPNYVWRVDPLNGLVNANAVVYTNNGNTNVAQALDDLYSGGAASVELDSLLAKVDAETDDTLRILRPVKSQDISILDNGQSVFFGDLNDSGRAGFKFQHATPSNGFYFYQASEGSGVFTSNSNIGGGGAQEDITKYSMYNIFDTPNGKFAWRMIPPGGSTFIDKFNIHADSISNWTGTSIIRGSGANLIFDTRENVSNPGYTNRMSVGAIGFNFASNWDGGLASKEDNGSGSLVFNGAAQNEYFAFYGLPESDDVTNIYSTTPLALIGVDSVEISVPTRVGNNTKIEGDLTVTGNITGTIAPSNITGFTDTTQVLRDSIEALKARIVALENPAPADTVASAATVNLNVTSKEQTFVITGTTNITTLNINNSINGGTITIIFQSNLDVTFPSTVIDLAAGDGTTGLGTVTTGGFKFITLFTHDSKYYGRQ